MKIRIEIHGKGKVGELEMKNVGLKDKIFEQIREHVPDSDFIMRHVTVMRCLDVGTDVSGEPVQFLRIYSDSFKHNLTVGSWFTLKHYLTEALSSLELEIEFVNLDES